MKGLLNKILIAVLAILISPCFVACHDATNEPLAEIVSFSEIKELDITALETQDDATGYFELDVTGKWSVSSDKMWVTFSTEADGEFYYDVQGAADVKRVYVKVSNVARGFAESNAVISLTAGNAEKTVAMITRPAKSYEFAVLAENDEPLDKIVIEDNATAWVRFKANFECGIIDFPNWLMEPVVENDGVRFNVATDFVPMEKEGTLVVANNSLTHKYELPINYVGMNPDIINIDGDSPWGWIVSLDGQEFKKDKASLSDDSEDAVVYGSLNMNVVCRDYSYKFVFTENISEKLYIKEGEEAWIRGKRDDITPEKVTITVAEFEEKSSRAGYLFAVPDALYENFKSTVEAGKDTITFASRNDSISIYNYVLADVVQKDAGFKVFRIDEEGNEVEEIICESDENADYYIKLSSEFTIDDVMACDVELGKRYVINTKLTSDEWSSNNGAWHDINAKSDEDIFPIKRLFKTKVKEHVDGYYRVTIEIPDAWADGYEELDKNIILRLFTSDGVNIKALVLRIQE